jgi:hypothetical protein
MRHFLETLPVSALPRRVRVPAIQRRLVPTSGLPAAPDASARATRRAAVPVPAVAGTAQEENLPALRPGARHEA